VYNSYGARLFTTETATYQWLRQIEENEQNLIYAAVKIWSGSTADYNRRLLSTYCTVEATIDRREASHGLSATAELPV